MDHYKVMREFEVMYGVSRKIASEWATIACQPPRPKVVVEVCPECKGTGLGPKVYEEEGFHFPDGLVGVCQHCVGEGRLTIRHDS